MPASHPSAQNSSIYRHCMQQLIQQALLMEQTACHGFLAGSGNIIKETVTQTAADINSSTLRGIYQCTDQQGHVDHKLTALLQQQFSQLTNRAPDYYMLLQCSHKGRVDALLFADNDFKQPLELDMQEDGDLYPVLASS